MFLTAVIVLDTCELNITRVSGHVFCSTCVQSDARFHSKLHKTCILQGNVVHTNM